MSTKLMDSGQAARLNEDCQCTTRDDLALGAALGAAVGDAGFYDKLRATRPHLFSHAPVFLPRADLEAMRAIVAGVEAAVKLEGYQAAALAWAPAIARIARGQRGAFMGYDFHVGADGPKLIEINTNAGGAFLNAFLGRAQIACCDEVEKARALDLLDGFDEAVMAMFAAEHRARTDTPLRRMAIVDDAPAEQYLYPEFLLAKALAERHGVETLVLDPSALRFEQGALWAAGQPIDLVYNRLVDFALAEPAHAALRAAYEADAVTVTPNPRNHALFADKRNLTLLSDAEALARWGLPEAARGALASLPRTVRVDTQTAGALWAARKDYFFKPCAGHGGKAVYRGDKITKGVWNQVVAGEYVAQAYAPPGERMIAIDGAVERRKMDVRLYTYDGAVLLTAARLYQGQTTNFRTPGGGFAPVFFL